MRTVGMGGCGILASALAMAVLGLATGAGAAELLTQKVLPLSLATQAAQAALSACEKEGFHVTVAVTDQSGLVRVLMRDDQAWPHTLDSSRKKAYTAGSLGVSTLALARIVLQHPELAGLARMNDSILLLQGGLPIKAGPDVLGGIGVGGTPAGETDEGCARAGLDAIAGQLK